MFWTDEGNNEAIKRANMDGSNVTTIVSTYLSLPKGITVDEANSRIYWTDSAYDIIESSQFDGSDRRTITRATDPFGVDIFGDFVFWVNTKDDKIMVTILCSLFYFSDVQHAVVVFIHLLEY